MTILSTGAVDLNVHAEGSGPAVIMLHGHTLDLRVWDEVAPALVASGLRVIRYDQRGHGRSASPPSGYRWGDHAADCAAVIENFSAAPAHVIGLSKGGGIAIELALRRPELVRSLVLVGPLVPDFQLGRELFDSFRQLAAAIRGGGVPAAMREVWLRHPLIASSAAIPGVRERLEAMLMTFPAGEYVATARDEPDREWRVTDRLGEIVAPALVVSGQHDVPDFRAMAALLSEQIPSSALEIVPECGHLVPLERPNDLADLILAFLDAT